MSTFAKKTLVLGCLSLAMLCLGTVYAARPIQVASSDSTDPLEQSNRAVLRRAYELVDTPVEIVNLPSRRGLKLLLEGKIDANDMRVADVVKEHPELVQVSVPINHAQIRIYSGNPSTVATSWADVNRFRVCHQRGILALERRLVEHTRTVLGNDNQDSIRMLQLGACDILLIVEDSRAASLNIPGLHRLPQVLETIDLFHTMLGRHRDLAKKLSTALTTMQRSGELQRLRLEPAIAP